MRDKDLQPIYPEGRAAPAGHYSPAIRCGDFLFVSGQLPLGPEGPPPSDPGFEAQVQVALGNLLEIVGGAGATVHHIVKVTAWIVGEENWAVFDRVYASVFGTAKPARAVIPVPRLHYGCLVEVDAIAYVGAR